MTRPISEVRLRSEADAAFGSDIEVRSLQGTESLGRPYELTVTFICHGPPPTPEALLDMPLTLELQAQTSEHIRRIHGIAARVSDMLTTESDEPIFRMVFVPRVWRLTLTKTTEIFMDMSVEEIIAAKLERAGLAKSTDFELRLREAYPRQEYVVQYDETDMAFVARLAEHVGITLFIEQDEARDRVVLTDHNEGFKLIDGGGTASFHRRGEQTGIYALESTTSTLPSQYVVKDYNYRTPQLPLKAATAIEEGRVGWQYEYGSHFKSPEEADFIAQIRAQEVACQRRRFEGRSTDLRFTPGVRLELEGHPLGEPELLLTEVTHDFRQTVSMDGATDEEQGYDNRFMAIHASRTFRPARVTPKPKIYGCITAQIESSGDGPYAEMDEDGRYHVRFLFDVADSPRGKATRLVRMAQPHAGPGYGFHFPLRHGVEVLITFIDGDPDRPIISSAVPNPQTPSVVGMNNGTRNIIRTGGGNEINIDDTEGSERIKLSTPFGGSSFQIGAPNSPSAGAALSTTESWNAVAGSAVTTASTAVSTFADILGCWSSGDVVAMAGATNVLNALMSKAPDIVTGIAKTVDGVMDVQSKAEQADIETAKRQAAEAEEQAKELRRRAATSPNMAAELGRQADAAEHRAAVARAQAKRLAEAKSKNDLDRRGVKEYTDAAKNLAGAEKVVGKARDAWSTLSKIMNKGSESLASSSATFAAAMGEGAAAQPRIPGVVPAPAGPKNLQMAVGSAALCGGVSALVSGGSNAACVSPVMAVLAGGATALVKSPGAAEVSGIGRCLLTSGATIDLQSGGKVKSLSGGNTTMRMGSGFGAIAQATVYIKAGGKMSCRSDGEYWCNAGTTAHFSSGGAMSVKAKGTYNVDATGKVRIKGPKVGCVASGAKMYLSGVAELLSDGTALVSASGACTVKGSSCKIDGSGGVTLKGSTIKASGRCLLG